MEGTCNCQVFFEEVLMGTQVCMGTRRVLVLHEKDKYALHLKTKNKKGIENSGIPLYSLNRKK